MFRYLILVGDPQSAFDERSLRNARRVCEASFMTWRCAMDRPGVYVAYLDVENSGDSAVRLEGEHGMILGRVFSSPNGHDQGSAEPLRAVSSDISEKIVHSMGQWLISQCWGYYVAVIHYPDRQSTFVLRGPVNPLACFLLRVGTLNVFFSNVEDCAALELSRLSINWDSITAQVVGGDYLTHETAINEIAALECGEAIEWKASGCIKHVYWDPCRFLQDRSLGRFSDAARSLRRGVDSCVAALSSTHNRILVNLSGGLDSSIVLSALARAPHGPVVTAVNYHSRGCGDERPYARTMAGSVDCRLVEHARNDGLDLHRFHDCNLTVRPVLHFSAPDVEARNSKLARDLEASAIFDGELGDNVFGRAPGPGVLVDYIRRRGIGPGFLPAATDYALLTKQSFWRTVALTCREAEYGFRRDGFRALQSLQARYGAEAMRSMLLASVDAEKHYSAMADRFLHPWLKDARRFAPDSHKLLFGLITVTSTAYHSPFSAPDDAQSISPLVSQPLVEIALRIPGYLHCRGGQDRAVARTAFSDVLPAEILNRGSAKGGPSLWAKDVVESNSTFLREFLLDGILVRQGLLDREKVQAALSPRIIKSSAALTDIFAKLYIEAWLRNFPKIGLKRA